MKQVVPLILLRGQTVFRLVGHVSRVRSLGYFNGFLQVFLVLAPAAPQALIILFYFHLPVHSGLLLHEAVLAVLLVLLLVHLLSLQLQPLQLLMLSIASSSYLSSRLRLAAVSPHLLYPLHLTSASWSMTKLRSR